MIRNIRYMYSHAVAFSQRGFEFRVLNVCGGCGSGVYHAKVHPLKTPRVGGNHTRVQHVRIIAAIIRAIIQLPHEVWHAKFNTMANNVTVPAPLSKWTRTSRLGSPIRLQLRPWMLAKIILRGGGVIGRSAIREERKQWVAKWEVGGCGKPGTV